MADGLFGILRIVVRSDNVDVFILNRLVPQICRMKTVKNKMIIIKALDICGGFRRPFVTIV